MIGLIEHVNETYLDMGQCCGIAYHGTAMLDYTDARQCENDATVALIEGEYKGLVLCEKCYGRIFIERW